MSAAAGDRGGVGDRSAADTARLFAALELPGSVIAGLGAWGKAQLEAVPGLHRVGSDALHVTLCFLGSRPVGEIEAIAEACSGLSGGGGVDLRLGRALWLPQRRPRVLAVGVEDDDRGLGNLQATLAGELQRGGWYQPEARPFLAHVTVGRFGRAGGREVALAAPPALGFPGTSVVLLRSWPEPGGSRFQRLAAVALTG